MKLNPSGGPSRLCCCIARLCENESTSAEASWSGLAIGNLLAMHRLAMHRHDSAPWRAKTSRHEGCTLLESLASMSKGMTPVVMGMTLSIKSGSHFSVTRRLRNCMLKGPA